MSGINANSDVRIDPRLTAFTSDLLVGFREPIWSFRRSTQTSNIVPQMCSIIFFVAMVMGELSCCSNLTAYANRPKDA